MSAGERSFFKSLRAGVRRAQAGKSTSRTLVGRMVPEWFTGALGLIAIVMLISGGISTAKTLEGGGQRALLSLLALLLALNFHGQLLRALYQHPDLLAQALLPASPEWVFRRHLRMGIWRLAWVPLAGASVAWVVQSAGPADGGVSWLWAGLGGAMLGAYLVALGILALRWRHAALTYRFGWAGIVLAWLGGTFTPGPVKERLLGWLNESGELITGLLPTGWLVGPGHRWLTGAGHPSDWLWLLLPLGLGSWLPPSLRWLGRNFHFREAVLLDYASEAPEGLSDEDREAFSEQLEPPPKVGVTDATDRILSRDFLAPAAAPTSGWIERQVWRWWTPRQRLLAEWDWAAEPGWTSAWKTGSLLLGGSVLVTLLGRALGWVFLEWALPVGGGLGGLILLPFWIALSGGRLQSGASQAVRLSEFGLMPRGMGETLALVTKAGLVRILAAMPVVVPYGTVVALMLDRPWWVGADFGLRACCVAGAITPVLLVTRVAKTTNDIRLGRFRAVLVLGWHLACLTLLGTALVAGFMADSGWWFLAAAPLVGRLWERGYRWALDRLWFDLMRRD